MMKTWKSQEDVFSTIKSLNCHLLKKLLPFANVNHKKTIEEKVLLQNNVAGGPRKENESFK